MKKSIPNMDRRIDEPPTMKELECLICWPKGTIGETKERQAIQKFLELCKDRGFGRMAQIAEQIDDIWRNPEKVIKYQKMKKKHFKLCGWDIK